MKLKCSLLAFTLLLFIIIQSTTTSMSPTALNLQSDSNTPQEKQEKNSATSIAKLYGYPIIFFETANYFRLNFTMFTVEFYKGTAGYNKIYNKDGSLLVYDSRIYVEALSGKNWKQVGTPRSISYKQITDHYYNVTRYYDDSLGTTYSVTWVITSDSPMKAEITLKSGSTQTYRCRWVESGIAYLSYTKTSQQLIFGDPNTAYSWIAFDWKDVYQTFGEITQSAVSTQANGKKLDLFFNLGEIPFGKSIIVDPTTVGTTTTPYAIDKSHQRKTFDALNLFWFFASDGTNMVWWTTSDALTWSDMNTVPSRTCNDGGKFCVDSDGTYVWYVYSPETIKQAIKWRRGTLASDGTISWGTEYNALAAVSNTFYSYLSTKVDTSGYSFIQYMYLWIDPVEGSFVYETRVTKNGNNNGQWANPTTWTLSTTVYGANCLVQLTSGKMYACYGIDLTTPNGNLYSGGSWGSAETLSSYLTRRYYISAVGEGDNVHFIQSTAAVSTYVGYPSSNRDSEASIFGDNWVGQSFKSAHDGECTELSVWLRRSSGLSSVDIKYRLYNADANGYPTGTYMCEETFPSFTDSTFAWRNKTTTLIPHFPVLNASLTYVFVVLAPTGTSDNKYAIGIDSSNPTYTNGKCIGSIYGGASWGDLSPNSDAIFGERATAYRIFYRKRTYDVGWGTETELAKTHQWSAPVLSILTSNNNLYVWWAGCPSDDHIYYRMYNASSASWLATVDWLTEAITLSLEEHITSTYSSANYLSVSWITNTASPFNIRHDYLPIITGYNLNLRVKDYDLTDNIPNAIVYKDADSKVSDANGWANWTAVSGTVSIKVKYYSFWVNGTFQVIMSSSQTINIKCNLYDVSVRLLPDNQQGILYLANLTAFNATSSAANKIKTGLSNETGYVALQNLPNNTLTFTCYHKLDYSEVIANVTRTVSSENQILSDIVCNQNYGWLEIHWEIIIIPTFSLCAKGIKRKKST